MPNRRDILKKGALGTALVGSAAIAGVGKVTAASRRTAGGRVESSPCAGDCTQEVIQETDEYTDVKVTGEGEAVDIRIYPESGRVELLAEYKGIDSNGTHSVSEQIKLPDPPALIKSVEKRQEVVSRDCDVWGIDNHWFVGAEISLTVDGTSLSSSVLAGILCALAGLMLSKHPYVAFAVGLACGVGLPFATWLLVDGYEIEGSFSIGVTDIDDGQFIHIPRIGRQYIQEPCIALMVTPDLGSSINEYEIYDTYTDIPDMSAVSGMPEFDSIGPLHMDPIFDRLDRV